MAVYFACGWEAGHRDVWSATYTIPGNVAVGGAFAHTGNYGLRVTGPGVGTNLYHMYLPAPHLSEFYASCWVKFHSGGNTIYRRLEFRFGGGSIFLRHDGAFLDAYVDAVKVADGGLAVPLDTWVHIEAYIHIADAGQIMTRINGYNDINYSGDTLPGVGDTVYLFIIYTGYSVVIDIDDVAFDNADWPGDVRIEGLVPNGVGDVTQWTPFPGGGEANWEDVDEVPPDEDTTYVYVGTDGQDDLYNLVDWVAAGNVPLAVVQYARGKKMSVDATAFQFLAREGAATEVSGLQTLTTAYKYFQVVLPTKPSGGPWTDAAIDALQGGQRSWI